MEPEGSITHCIGLLKARRPRRRPAALGALLPPPGRPGPRRLRGRPAARGRRGGRGPRAPSTASAAAPSRPVPPARRPRRPLAAAVRHHRPQGDRPGPPRGPADARRRPGARPSSDLAGRDVERRPRPGADARVRRPGGRGVPAAARRAWATTTLRPVAVWKLEGYTNAEIAAQARLRRADGRAQAAADPRPLGRGGGRHERSRPRDAGPSPSLARARRRGVRPLRGRLEGRPAAPRSRTSWPRCPSRSGRRCSASCWPWSWPTAAGGGEPPTPDEYRCGSRRMPTSSRPPSMRPAA